MLLRRGHACRHLESLWPAELRAPSASSRAGAGPRRAPPPAPGGARAKSALSAAAEQLAAGAPRAPSGPQALEGAGRWLLTVLDTAAGAHARSGVDAANGVFSALGLQIWIVQPSSPDARVRISVPPEVPAPPEPGAAAGLTPRQFVRFMREAREAQSGGCELQAYVGQMLAEGRLQPIPLLSAQLQRRLYVDIAQLIVCSFQRSLLTLDGASLWGHRLRVASQPAPPTARCARRRSAVGQAQLRAIVDQMLASQAVHMPFLPRPLERRLYHNCMAVVFQLVEDLLTRDGEEVSVAGHRLLLRFEAQPVELVRRLMEEKPLRHCRINEPALRELVEELLADAQTNIRWMPDVLESQMYLSAMRLLIRIAEHVLCRLRLSVLGREINMSVLSHLDAEARGRAPAADAALHLEQEETLRAVSTTELEERLKDLQEQRRILEALRQLGGARFDLTADTPLLGAAPGGGAPGAQGAGAGTPGAGAPGAGAEAEEMHEFQRLAHTLKLARSLSVKCEVGASVDVPWSMIADLETYPLWMPWCTSGRLLPGPAASDEGAPACGEGEAVFDGEVGFGFETGTFLGTVGDNVFYRVHTEAPAAAGGAGEAAPEEGAAGGASEGGGGSGRVTADAVNGFTYGKRLVYDWRFHPLGPERTRVELDMLFQARSVLYMPLWDSMQNMVVNNMLSAFVARAEELHRQRLAGGGGEKR